MDTTVMIIIAVVALLLIIGVAGFMMSKKKDEEKETDEKKTGSAPASGTTPPDPVIPNVDCKVSDWNSCSAACGGGKQTRTILVQPSGNGKLCGQLEQACNTFPCMVVPPTFSIKSQKTNQFCADEVNRVICDRNASLGWEKFTAEKTADNFYILKGGQQGKFCKVDVNNANPVLSCNESDKTKATLFTLNSHFEKNNNDVMVEVPNVLQLRVKGYDNLCTPKDDKVVTCAFDTPYTGRADTYTFAQA